jgi:hypothetical protein
MSETAHGPDWHAGYEIGYADGESSVAADADMREECSTPNPSPDSLSDGDVRGIYEEGIRAGLHRAASLITAGLPPGDRDDVTWEVCRVGQEIRSKVLRTARSPIEGVDAGTVANVRGRFVTDEETRHDGSTVKKSRWQSGIRNIVSILGWNRREFEVTDVVEEVRKLVVERGAVTSGILLRGWRCASCKAFNGSEKDELSRCRSCDAERPS